MRFDLVRFGRIRFNIIWYVISDFFHGVFLYLGL